VPGLDPGTHVFSPAAKKTWMAGINPAKEIEYEPEMPEGPVRR
jgi:hypothetical protein